jgi:hypothetical protein
MNKILILILFTPIFSYGFEVQGYSTGMSKEAVKSLASKSYKVIENDDGAIEASDVEGTGKNGLYFIFCKDKLTNVNIFWEANFKNLVLVSNDFQKKYGSAASSVDIKSLNSYGTHYGMNLFWYKGKDQFSILYGSNESGRNNMTVVYQTTSSCWK